MEIDRDTTLTDAYNDMVGYFNLKKQYRDYLLNLIRKLNTEMTLMKSNLLEIRAGIIKEELGERNYD